MERYNRIAGYEVIQRAAERIGVDESQVRRLCREGRIPGAVKVGRQWLVPEASWPEETGFGRPPEWSRNQLRSTLPEEG